MVDIGCGHGFGALALVGVAERYVGLDIDPEAIRWAREHVAPLCPGAEFYALVASDDLRDWRGFDLALAFEVVEHVQDPAALLRQIAATVRPGGRIVLSTPNGENSQGRPELYVSPFHVREFELRDVSDLLRQCHLTARYYIEYRVDGLDLIGRRALGRPLGRNLGVAPTSARTRLLSRLNSLWNDHLNGPTFWRIRELDPDRAALRPYSTILATIPIEASPAVAPARGGTSS